MLPLEDAPRESIRASRLGGASTVKVERSRASNTFTAHSEPYNREAIHACCRLVCVEPFRDDLRAPQRGVRLSEWERGIGTAESTERTAQMITFRKTTRSLWGKEGKAQSPRAEAVSRICDRDVMPDRI